MTHIPPNDSERLAAVRRYDILDTPPDGTFDRITELAARLFDVPIAIVSIVDEDRIWFKSHFGIDAVQEIPRDPGLCASVICDSEVYVAESARTDPRTLANPLVAGEFGLQFYAAAPLQTHDGFRLGTLCLLDRETRRFSSKDGDVLERLASIVMDELELRLQARHTVSTERALREEASQLASTLQRAMLPRAFPTIANVRFDAVYVPAGTESEVGGDWYDAFLVDPDHLLLSIGDVAGHGLTAAAVMGTLWQSLRALALTERSPVTLLRLLDALLRTENEHAIVTAFVAVIDLRSRTMHYANAGHPPPLLRSSAGQIRDICGTGVPLGLRSSDEPPDASVSLPPKSVLLLYSDGLTELTRNLTEGEEKLKAALAKPAIALAPNPARALGDALLPASPRDDVVIMSVSFD